MPLLKPCNSSTAATCLTLTCYLINPTKCQKSGEIRKMQYYHLFQPGFFFLYFNSMILYEEMNVMEFVPQAGQTLGSAKGRKNMEK